MDRRNFLIGMGAASAGGSILLGSGAFSRIESDRYVTIAVAEDPNAYLGLDACDSAHGDNYVDIDDNGHLYVDIGENPNGGEGVNSNSRTWFDDAFQICNQGKQTAYVYVDADENWPTVDAGAYEDEPRVDFYLGENQESILGEENALEIDVGECTCVGIQTTTHGVDATDVDSLLEELDDVVTIVAATEPPDSDEPPVGETVFEVSDLDPTEITVERAETFDVSATVTNAGDAAGEGAVEFLVDGDAVDEQTVSLDPGNSETVSFEDVPTDDLDPDEYTFAVATDDDEVTGTLSVLWNIPEEERPPTVVPGEGPLVGDAPSDATFLWNGDDATLDGWEEVSMGPAQRVAHREDSTTEEWGDMDTGDPQWNELEDDTGSFLRVNESAGDIWTTEHFGDCQFHMEYRMQPDATGSGEGLNNSGLFFLGHYEIQILDNYDNQANPQAMHGSFYGQHAPLRNPARDPTEEEWQTYDVLWRSPRWEDGELVRPAQATVIVNGVVKLAHVNGHGPTGGGGGDYSEDHPSEGPILLQSHTDEPEYRNIWVRDLPEQPIGDVSPADLPVYDTSAGKAFPEQADPGGFGTSGEPPVGAEVLIDGSGLDGWVNADGGDPGWNVHDEYVEVEPGAGDIETEEPIGDCLLHLEWRVPEDAGGVGTDRANSGVFLMGEYGFQTLDNYGNPTPPESWVGSYIDQAPPHVSPIRAPGEWQYFDIVWQGPRFDDGELTHPAQATVYLNGVAVQKRLVLDGPNREGGPDAYEPHEPEAPLRLQDGDAPVQFRNVWYQPLAEEDEDEDEDTESVPIPYGLNVGGVSEAHPDLSPDDTVEYDGVEFEPYTESIDPHPGVTLVSDHNESGSNGLGHEIEGTDADEIYQTMMWSSDEFGYEFAVEPGIYNVTLHVAEIHFNVEGGAENPGPDQERTYSAWVNGEPAFEALETWEQPLQAMSFTVENVEVDEEPIVIELESQVENPMLNGIDIRDVD